MCVADGWFKPGDIGKRDANGHLKILDRKINLVKASKDESIALGKVYNPPIPGITVSKHPKLESLYRFEKLWQTSRSMP